MDIPYTLVRSKRKTVALIVQRDGALLVRAPLRLSRRAVEEFINQKSAWIRSRQEIARAAPPAPAPRQYRSGEVFTFLGKDYPLEIAPVAATANRRGDRVASCKEASGTLHGLGTEPSFRMLRPGKPITSHGREMAVGRKGEAPGMLPGFESDIPSPVLPYRMLRDRPYTPKTPALEMAGEHFRLSPAAQSRAAEVFTAWYKQQARRVIEERVRWYATRFGLKYARVRISSARTRWGSCSSRGTLSFTWRLVMAPLEVVDYVVAHELAHLRVKNHSPAFWREVESILPDYKARQKWLKTNGGKLEL